MAEGVKHITINLGRKISAMSKDTPCASGSA